MDIDVTRRQAIAGGGVLVVLGSGLGVAHVLRGASFEAPEVPTDALESDNWAEVDNTQEVVLDSSAGPVNVEAKAVTTRWEDRGLLQQIKDTDVTVEALGVSRTYKLGEFTGSQFEQSMGVFAATKIDVTPHVDELPGGIGRGQVMDQVRTQAQETFEEQLRNAGLEDVEQVGTSTLDVDTGQTADVFEYEATFRFEETTVDVEGGSIQIPAADIDIAGYLAIWHTGANVLIAAGAHPNENYSNTVTDTVQGTSVELSFDLGLQPSQMREDLLGYMAAVE